jgi:DNA-directed RNA polymerase specialized sigma24 family protein
VEPTVDPSPVRTAAPAVVPRPEDQAGWEEMMRRHHRRLRRRIRSALAFYRIRACRDVVDEVAQEVYCRLLAQGGRRLAQCRAEDEEQMAAYLARVAERVVINQIRIGSAAKRGGGLVGLDWSRVGGLVRNLADPLGTPEDRVLARERLAHLAAACRQAAAGAAGRGDARILRLALFDGWTSREISRHLGGRLAPSSVDSRIHRMRRRAAGSGLELPRRGPLPGSRRRRRRRR